MRGIVRIAELTENVGIGSHFAEVRLFRGKREQKAALNVVTSNTIASFSNILPRGFVVRFVVDRREKVSP